MLPTSSSSHANTTISGLELLQDEDPQLARILDDEEFRQQNTLSLVASCSVVDPAVLAAQSSAAVNVTAEGYPGRRYHAGCAEIDRIERLAIDRAESLFGARYANVQPHSASTANYTVLTSLLAPGDTLLGMDLNSGGHLTHGSPAALSGRYWEAIGYGLGEDGLLDYDHVRDLALEHRPKVIISGATAYPRHIDFAAFRAIADEVGAVLMADVSHTAGLVAHGLHPSPIDHAHITTTCTHKQLAGPRGGIILSGQDADEELPGRTTTPRKLMQRAVFPFSQGAPALHTIAAKAAVLQQAASPQYRQTVHRIRELASVFVDEFRAAGLRVVTDGSDNHTVLLDLGESMSGLVAEEALEECGIVVNKNRVPGDPRAALVTSGLRIGTNAAAQRRLSDEAARQAARLVVDVLNKVEPSDDRNYSIAPSVVRTASARARTIARAFPLPRYDREATATAAA